MKKVLIIANPSAADGHSRRLLLGSHLLKSHFDLINIDVQSASSVVSTVRRLNRSETAAIVIVGGDGTVNRFLFDVAVAGVPVAVFPAGTVNDLALELGMTANWEDLRSLILEGRYASHTMLQVNGRPFIVYGTLGLGAHTSRRIQQTRTKIRFWRHLFPTIQTPLFTAFTILFTNSYRKRMRLRIQGNVHDVESPGIYVVNQRFINRRVDLGWNRLGNNGLFRMVVFKPISEKELLAAVFRLNKQKHLDAIRAVVDVYDVQNAELESADGSPILFVGDGEPVVEAAKLEISAAPAPLILYCSRSSGTVV